MPKYVLAFLLVVVMLSEPYWVTAQKSSSNKGSSVELQSAQQAISAGQYQLALKRATFVIQKANAPNSLVAEAYLLQANAFLKQEKLELSLKAFDQAKKLLLSLPNQYTLLHAQYYNDLGHYYFAENQIKKAHINYEKSYTIRKKNLGAKSPEVASSKNNIGNCFYAEKKYHEALEAYHEALLILKDGLPQPVELAALYNNLANCHSSLGDFEIARIYYKKCLAIREKVLGPTNAEIFHCMRNIGKLNLDLNELDSAKIYIKTAMAGYQKNAAAARANIADAQMDLSNVYLAEGTLDSARMLNQQAFNYYQAEWGNDNYKTGRSLRQMGQIQMETGSYAKALNCFQRTKSIFDAYEGIEDELASLQDDLGNAYSYLGLWDQSLSAHLSALQLRQFIYPPNHAYIAGSLINLGLYFQHSNDYETAIEYFLKAESILGARSTINSNSLITLYNNLGNCYTLQKRHKRALDYYEKAGNYILANGTNRQKADYYRNKGQALSHLGQYEPARKWLGLSLKTLDYTPSKDPTHLSDPSGIVYSLWFMGNSLKAHYVQTKSDKLLKEAADFYNRAIQIIEGMGSTFVDSKDKLKLSENFKSILEDYLEIEFMRYALDKQETHLQQAFIISEKNKNIFLNDIWQNRLHTSNDWSLVNGSIAQLEKELTVAENDPRYSHQQRKDLERKLLQKKNELDSIQKKLIPRMNRQKTAPYFPTLYSVMQREQAGLITYFVGERSVFAFYIGQMGIKGFQVERKKIDDLVYTFVSSIVEYPIQNLKGQVRADSTYIESALGLYRDLWKPLFKGVSQVPSRIFVSPDGILGFLPFEAILTKAPVERQRYRNYPFLILDCELSYVQTILPFLDDVIQTKSSPLKCLKFAPSFVDHPMGLAELSYNQEEVKAISKIVGGKALIGKRADLSSFIANAPHYPVIHLATHGKASGRNGALSFLAFAEVRDSIDNEYLYLNDLQGFSLHAEMVVLSACESGIGEFQYGEGLISIARGFSMANARSVISTLWSINDAKTVKLMTSFYRYLSKAERKSKALQQAKIDFLGSCTHEEAHPFFWSAFVPYGDMRAFDAAGFKMNKAIILLILGIAILFVLGWMYYKSNTSSLNY